MNRTPFILILLSLVLLKCSNSPVTGGEGNGSETIARGVVVDNRGIPAANVPVQLLPTAHNPVTPDTSAKLWRTTTNSSGEYTLIDISAGTYALEAGLSSANEKALITKIQISGERTEAVIDTGRLEKTGTIVVQLPHKSPESGGYLYLPGTSTFTIITDSNTTNGQAVLHNVPTGTYTDIVYVATTNAQNIDLLPDTITLIAGDTVESAFIAWKKSAKVQLNTTSSGANIQDTVYNFPIVIKLNATTFDFSQARTNGEDLLFTKPDGTPLAFEIERWDANAKLAEVWVKIDTIFGNNATQYITMHWNNPNAASVSSGASVFDTSAGFVGVWHLGEHTGSLSDATINKHTGSRNGKQAWVQGCVGDGQHFSGSGDYTDLGNIGNPGMSSFSVSAWVKLSTSKGYRTLISKSNGTTPSALYGWTVELGPDGELIIFMATGSGEWGETGTFVLSSKGVGAITDTIAWHHIAVTIDRSGNSGCKVYIDGSDVSDTPAGGDITSIGSLINTVPLRIGAESDGDAPWVGGIDECTIARTVRPAAWIRLCYINQGSNDLLVTLR